ncbi:hypothetical protein GGI07_001520 [Coemansia sp. Benny D115]|nr:hypothetical protein GGI07_001520 [Coemansia sp. Benny D115]
MSLATLRTLRLASSPHAALVGRTPSAQRSSRMAASVLSYARLSQQRKQQMQHFEQSSPVFQQMKRAKEAESVGILPAPAKKYVYKHNGSVPPSPQALSSIEFILNELPLGQTSGRPMVNSVLEDHIKRRREMADQRIAQEKTIAKATATATANGNIEQMKQQLVEFDRIVKGASQILNALTKASERHVSGTQSVAVAETESNESQLHLQGPVHNRPNTKRAFMWTMAAAATVASAVGGFAAFGSLLLE